MAEYAPDAPVWSETLGQWQTHPALDIAGSPGEAVYACREGVVSEAWSDRLWGNVVVIDRRREAGPGHRLGGPVRGLRGGAGLAHAL